ncbi:MAG: hypothetical protein R2939_06895 [Kofleriaceae bacterium]
MTTRARAAVAAAIVVVAAGGCRSGAAGAAAPAPPPSTAIGNLLDGEGAGPCWPGQRYDVDDGRCAGRPSSCPDDREARDDTCWRIAARDQVALGDRVRCGGGACGEHAGGLGTVVGRDADAVVVRWDTGAAATIAVGSGTLARVNDAPPPTLAPASWVVGGPRCRGCGEEGEVVRVDGARAIVRWGDGDVASHPIGLDGVLPRTQPRVRLVVGARVRRSAPADATELGTVIDVDAAGERARVRWDGGSTRGYHWRDDSAAIALAPEAPPPTLAVGWRVTAGPSCDSCGEHGEVVATPGGGQVEVRWRDAVTPLRMSIGVDGVLPAGPPLPAVAVGARVGSPAGPGTVIAQVSDGWLVVHWDRGVVGQLRHGADGVDEAVVVSAPLPTVVAGATVRDACYGCTRRVGVVERRVGASVEVRWPDDTLAMVAVGAGGVLPWQPMSPPPPAGTRVRRGGDWEWGPQDTEDAYDGDGTGVVTGPDEGNPDWVKVEWSGGGDNSYRWGADGAYDLEVIAP